MQLTAQPRHHARQLVSTLAACLVALVAAAPAAADVTYTYDLHGRLATVDYGDGQVTTFSYDPATNIVAETHATSDNTLRVAISPHGAGTVAGDGIACPPDCVEPFGGTPTVTLTAIDAAGFDFVAWGGDVTSATNPTPLQMAGDRFQTCFFGAEDGHTDGDGLADMIEMGPNGDDPAYDGDGNGVPDYQEARATSLASFNGASYVTLAVPDGLALTAVEAVGNPDPGESPPPGVSFPFGFFEFTISGLEPDGCTTLDLFVPTSPRIDTYYKWGPEPDDPVDHWYEFVHYHPALPGAEIIWGSAHTVARLFLCDGQKGDDVFVADALIIDAGGPAGPIAPQISVAPTDLDFGQVFSGATAQLTVDVASVGDNDLTLGSIAGSNPLDAPFSLAADTCSGATLPPGAGCSVTVQFTSTAPGTYSDTFDIPSNDPGNPALTIAVRGEILLAEAIPTLGELGLATLALLLACLGFELIRRRGTGG